MKKLYILLLVAILPYLGFSQLVTNSTFTTDTNGWAVNGAGSTVNWSQTEGEAAPGAMVLTAAAAAARAQSSPNTIPTLAGDYLVTAKVKGAIGTTIQPIVFQTGNTKTGIAQSLTGGWDTITFLATGLNNTATANLRLVAGSAGIFYIDDVYFTYQIPPGSILTTNVAGIGTVTKTPNQVSYPTATSVLVTAVPATHWLFNNWTGDLVSSINPANVNLDGTTNKTVTANFVIDPAFDYDFKFDTDGDSEGWVANAGTATVASGSLSLYMTGGTPKISLPANFTIPATGHNLVSVTLVNNTPNTLLRVAHPKSTTGTDYTEMYIVPNTSTPITYTVDLANSDGWVGNVGTVELIVKGPENTLAIVPGTIEFQDVKFHSGSTEQLVYDFNGSTSEGWGFISGNGSIIDVSSGNLTFKPIVDKFAKIILGGFKVNSANANSVRVTLTNQSTGDDQIKISLADGSVSTNVPVPVSSSEAVYTIPLLGLAGWTGDVSQISLGFASSTAVIPGQSSGTGNFLINKIEFFLDPLLGVNTVNAKNNDISLYPNPAKAVLNISTANKVTSIVVYDVTGKQVLETTNLVNNQINISTLKNGLYLVKLIGENNTSVIKKLLIDN